MVLLQYEVSWVWSSCAAQRVSIDFEAFEGVWLLSTCDRKYMHLTKTSDDISRNKKSLMAI